YDADGLIQSVLDKVDPDDSNLAIASHLSYDENKRLVQIDYDKGYVSPGDFYFAYSGLLIDAGFGTVAPLGNRQISYDSQNRVASSCYRSVETDDLDECWHSEYEDNVVYRFLEVANQDEEFIGKEGHITIVEKTEYRQLLDVIE